MTDAPQAPKTGLKRLIEGLLIGCVWMVAALGIYGAVRTIHQLRAELAQRTVDVEVETVTLLNQNKHLMTKVEQLQTELENTKAQFEQAMTQNKSLMQEMTKARESVTEMTNNLTELQQAHDALLQEKVAMSTQLDEFKRSHEAWKAQEQDFQQRMAALKQEVAPVEKVRRQLTESLEDERKARERERLGFEADVRALKKQLQDAKEDHARVETLLDKTRRELHTATVESEKDRALGDLSTSAYKKLSEELRDKLRDASNKLAVSLRHQHRLEEDNASMHYNLARLFTEHQKYDLAASEYLKVLEIKPEDADAHYNLAVLYDNYLSQRQKAIQHYRQYLRIQPSAKDSALIEGIILSLEAQERVGEQP